MFNAIFSAVVYAAIAVGLVEVIKNFLPENFNSVAKTVLGVVIEVVVAVLGAFIFDANETLITKIAIVVAAVGLAQVFYATILSLLTKLKDFLKSKTSENK